MNIKVGLALLLILSVTIGVLLSENRSVKPEVTETGPPIQLPSPGLPRAGKVIISGKPVDIPASLARFDDIWTLGTKAYDDDWCNYYELLPSELVFAETTFHSYLNSLGHFVLDPTNLSGVNLEKVQVAWGLEDYASLSRSSMKSLAESGDLKAMHSLYAREDATISDKQWAAREAAISGATVLPKTWGNDLMSQALHRAIESKFQIENIEEYLDGLAWTYFSIMRGEIFGWKEALTLFTAFNSDAFNDRHLSEEELTYIRRKGKDLYYEIARERRKRNLGDFEPMPKSAVAIYNLELAASIYANKGQSPMIPEELLPTGECWELTNTWAKEVADLYFTE